MKNSVVVIRIDEGGIEHAKQVYSSVYLRAGWKGDFLILSHEILSKDLSWFREKGVFIRKCKPLFRVGIWWPMTTSKLYIFSAYMKQWKHVIYLDTDVIVNASLDRLTRVKGYAASADIDEQSLYLQLHLRSKQDWNILHNIEKITRQKYNLFRSSFNTGVFAFNTDILKKDTFKELIALLRVAAPICKFGEQTMQNLYFYNRWEKLPRVYNVVPRIYMRQYKISKRSLRAIIFHFAGHIQSIYKPWHFKNPFYKDWNKSLQLAYSVSADNVPPAVDTWSEFFIWTYDRYLMMRRFVSMSWPRKADTIQEFYKSQTIELKEFIRHSFPDCVFLYKQMKQLFS